MFLFSLAIYLGALWFLPFFGPWLALALATFILGADQPSVLAHLRLGAAAALGWIALAASEDLANADRISLRLAGLFTLPKAWMVFPLFGALIFVSVFLAARAGGGWRKPR